MSNTIYRTGEGSYLIKSPPAVEVTHELQGDQHSVMMVQVVCQHASHLVNARAAVDVSANGPWQALWTKAQAVHALRTLADVLEGEQ